MRTKTFALIMVTLLFVACPTIFVRQATANSTLQQTTPLSIQCDTAAPLAVIGQFVEALTSGKTQDALDKIQVLFSTVGEFEAQCSGLHWSGHGKVILGPMTIPDGIYRVELASNGPYPVGLSFTVLTGKCDNPLLVANANETDLGVSDISGCQAIIQVGNTDTDWSLSYELITTR